MAAVDPAAPARSGRGCRARSLPAAAATVGDGVAVSASTIPGAGLGLFATRAFASGALVTAFDGELLSPAELRAAELRTHTVQHDGLIVAGLREPVLGRGGGSFANDCTGSLVGRRPNAELHLHELDLGRLFLRVRRGQRIEPGDEIFVSYGSGASRAARMGAALAPELPASISAQRELGLHADSPASHITDALRRLAARDARRAVHVLSLHGLHRFDDESMLQLVELLRATPTIFAVNLGEKPLVRPGGWDAWLAHLRSPEARVALGFVDSVDTSAAYVAAVRAEMRRIRRRGERAAREGGDLEADAPWRSRLVERRLLDSPVARGSGSRSVAYGQCFWTPPSPAD